MQEIGITECFLCGGQMSHYLTGRDYLYETSNNDFSIYRCDNCHLEKIHPTPEADVISSFYPTNYYSYAIQKENSIFKRVRIWMVAASYRSRLARFFIEKIIGYFVDFGIPLASQPGGSFLDIGCGDGFYVDLMYKFGWDSNGFEIGEKGKKGRILYASDLAKAGWEGKQFDRIRLWHVLEHVPDPDEFLLAIQNLLKDDGILSIGLPNMRSWHARLFKQFCFSRDVPRHLFNYNVKNIPVLLRKSGFRVTEIKYQSINMFAGSLQHVFKKIFGKQFAIYSNPIIIILLYPLEFIANLFRRGDVLVIKAQKK